jgi:hypothetical protein
MPVRMARGICITYETCLYKHILQQGRERMYR